MTDLPIVCTLTDSERQQRRTDLLRQVAALMRERKPLDSGYAFRFGADDASLDAVMQVIRLERQCCSFLQFRLTVEPGGGPVWLELTGPAGAKKFLEAELGF